MMISNHLLIEAKQYLQGIFGHEACSGDWASPWSKTDHLPFFLQTPYTYFQARLFGQSCLLMLARAPEGETPAVVRKHWQTVSKLFDGYVIYIVTAVNSYNRKRLIEQGVQFLVPGNQLYLPTLGVDLREYFKPGRPAEITHLSSPAQVILLREILNHDCSDMSAKDLAHMLGYSPMTITRAINELTHCQLAMAEKVGREKHLSFPSGGRSLWEAARPVLRNPVTKRIWIVPGNQESWQANFTGRTAGESALARYTDLANSHISQWAIPADTWLILAKSQDVQVLASQPVGEVSHQRHDRDVMELELWAYNPDVITIHAPLVDPLSLWLSFDTNTDERIEIARESLLEQVWRT